MIDILSILGRGIQRIAEGKECVLTEDLEITDEKSAHLDVRVPPDDQNPFCLMGGGELNLLAGVEVYKEHRPKVVVCAYGDRALYLKTIGAPSESMVMSGLFAQKLAELKVPMPEIIVWGKERSKAGPSNTRSELENIFLLATEKKLWRVGIVTIDVHMPRTLVLVQRHLTRPEFNQIHPHFFASEAVLVEADPDTFGLRRQKLRKSQSFGRTWKLEQLGIYRTLIDAYGDEKPTIEV